MICTLLKAAFGMLVLRAVTSNTVSRKSTPKTIIDDIIARLVPTTGDYIVTELENQGNYFKCEILDAGSRADFKIHDGHITYAVITILKIAANTADGGAADCVKIEFATEPYVEDPVVCSGVFFEELTAGNLFWIQQTTSECINACFQQLWRSTPTPGNNA